jgi:AcrR family transcriptional regulator
MPEEPSNSPSKGSKTKKKILEVSLKLFSEQGYKETSVRDIAGVMGVKQSALYNHFKNKDSILETLIKELNASALTTLFEGKEESALQGKSFLVGIATTFKLIGFDKKNEALLKLLMQELYRNSTIREIYNELYYQENVKKLSGIFFSMMQHETIKSSDPLLLANEFLSPLFFYLTQIILLKMDNKSTSSLVSMFEKHADYFWDNIRVEKEQQTTLF